MQNLPAGYYCQVDWFCGNRRHLESFVLAELYKTFAHVVIDTCSKLIPIEIKSSETVNRSFFDGMKYYISLGSPVSEAGVLIHGGRELYEREKCIVRPWFQSV